MKTVKWTESFSFSRERASEFKMSGQGYIKLFLFYLVLFGGASLLISVHGTIPTLLGALVLSLVFLGFTWVVNFLPQCVYVNKKGIGSGKTLIPYKDIDMAVLGTMELGGKTFNILSVTTVNNIQHLYGLGAKVNSEELSETLKDLGVNVQ